MSWSLIVSSVFGDTAEAELADAQPTGQDAELPHVAEAVHAAKKAAVAIIRSGSVGTPGQTYAVYLSGHANPDHRPLDGWSNDGLTVTVTQRSPEQT